MLPPLAVGMWPAQAWGAQLALRERCWPGRLPSGNAQQGPCEAALCSGPAHPRWAPGHPTPHINRSLFRVRLNAEGRKEVRSGGSAASGFVLCGAIHRQHVCHQPGSAPGLGMNIHVTGGSHKPHRVTLRSQQHHLQLSGRKTAPSQPRGRSGGQGVPSLVGQGLLSHRPVSPLRPGGRFVRVQQGRKRPARSRLPCSRPWHFLPGPLGQAVPGAAWKAPEAPGLPGNSDFCTRQVQLAVLQQGTLRSQVCEH